MRADGGNVTELTTRIFLVSLTGEETSSSEVLGASA
jgi:hypothetical protein